MYSFCLTFPYSFFLALGGLIGYLKKGSMASLIAGGGSGGVLAVLGYLQYATFQKTGSDAKALVASSLVVSMGLSIMMGVRYSKNTVNLTPGLIAGTSLLMSLFYLYRLVVPMPQVKRGGGGGGGATKSH